MTVVTRVRDKRAGPVVRSYVAYPPLFTKGWRTNIGTPLLGTYQSISSEYDGIFRPGLFRVNPVTIRKETASSNPSSLHEKLESFHHGFDGDLAAIALGKRSPAIGSDSSLTIWPQSLADSSLVKAWRKTAEPDLDVGIMLGELRETLEGLYRPFNGLSKFLKDNMKNLNRLDQLQHARNKLAYEAAAGAFDAAKSRRIADMLASLWMEMRYGLIPVCKDIQAIIEHVLKLQKLEVGKMRRKAGTTKFARNWSEPLLGDIDYHDTKGRLLVEVRQKATSKVYFTTNILPTWQEAYGLDALSVPGIAWELVSRSFVLDWFYGVGNWISMLKTFSDKRTYLGSCTSVKTVLTATAVLATAKYKWAGRPEIPTEGDATLKIEQLVRRVNEPRPLSPVVMPGINNVFKLVDALSLIWQNMPKLKR